MAHREAETLPAVPVGDEDDELISLAAAAALFGTHKSTFRRYSEQGDAPEPVILGARGAGSKAQAYRYWKSEVLAARAALPRKSVVKAARAVDGSGA